MYPARKPLLSMVIMGALTAILTSSSVLGNSFVLMVITRFKSLRTVPNILVANLALVDLLNAVINLPFYMIYTVLEASWFRGKTLAIVTSVLDRLFTILNLASMLAMMTNTYLAISFDLRYFGWKTDKKALVGVGLIWFISFVVVMLFSMPLLDIDLGDVHVTEYRAEIFKQGKKFVASFMALFLIFGAVVCFLTTRTIKKKKKERHELNLPRIQAEARLKDDIKAMKTIAITIAIYFLCYVPAIVFAVLGLQKGTLAASWFAFITVNSLHISSAINPIVYYLRTGRCRSAFKQFLKDPCGSSDFEEKPNRRRNAEKRQAQGQVMARKRDGERVENGDAFKVGSGVNQMRPKYLGKPMHGMVILSVENLQVDLHVRQIIGDGSGYGEGKAEKGVETRETGAPNFQMKNSRQGKGEETEQRQDQVPEECGSKKEYGNLQPSSSGNQVHPLGFTEMGQTGEQDGEKEEVCNDCSEGKTCDVQESSGKQRNDIRTGQKFEKVLKTAWIN